MILSRSVLIPCLILIFAGVGFAETPASQPSRPQVGQTAADFTLAAIDGHNVQLTNLTKDGPVILIVLRGWPGYQCPACSRQVGAFLSRADELSAKGAKLLLVYPGPSEELQEHAEEFVSGKTLPENFVLLLDPDFTFTAAYALRWDAPNETAYPSTFVIDTANVVRYAKISDSHGGRAEADEVLPVIDEITPR